jgi:hypothetical protein
MFKPGSRWKTEPTSDGWWWLRFPESDKKPDTIAIVVSQKDAPFDLAHAVLHLGVTSFRLKERKSFEGVLFQKVKKPEEDIP